MIGSRLRNGLIRSERAVSRWIEHDFFWFDPALEWATRVFKAAGLLGRPWGLHAGALAAMAVAGTCWLLIAFSSVLLIALIYEAPFALAAWALEKGSDKLCRSNRGVRGFLADALHDMKLMVDLIEALAKAPMKCVLELMMFRWLGMGLARGFGAALRECRDDDVFKSAWALGFGLNPFQWAGICQSRGECDAMLTSGIFEQRTDDAGGWEASRSPSSFYRLGYVPFEEASMLAWASRPVGLLGGLFNWCRPRKTPLDLIEDDFTRPGAGGEDESMWLAKAKSSAQRREVELACEPVAGRALSSGRARRL